MGLLKDTYPLYLNNKAAQPNTDLAVTDKFTGEVAFRTALATPDVIEQAIAGAVRAAKPMARLASYEKQGVLDHCVARFKERFDELRARGGVIGTPNEVVEILASKAGAGIESVQLQWLDFDDIAGLELIASSVLPQLRR